MSSSNASRSSLNQKPNKQPTSSGTKVGKDGKIKAMPSTSKLTKSVDKLNNALLNRPGLGDSSNKGSLGSLYSNKKSAAADANKNTKNVESVEQSLSSFEKLYSSNTKRPVENIINNEENGGEVVYNSFERLYNERMKQAQKSEVFPIPEPMPEKPVEKASAPAPSKKSESKRGFMGKLGSYFAEKKSQPAAPVVTDENLIMYMYGIDPSASPAGPVAYPGGSNADEIQKSQDLLKKSTDKVGESDAPTKKSKGFGASSRNKLNQSEHSLAGSSDKLSSKPIVVGSSKGNNANVFPIPEPPMEASAPVKAPKEEKKGIMGNIRSVFKKKAAEPSEEEQWKYIYGLEEMPPAAVDNTPVIEPKLKPKRQGSVIGKHDTTKSQERLNAPIPSIPAPYYDQDDDDEDMSSFEKIFQGKIPIRHIQQQVQNEEDDEEEDLTSFERIYKATRENAPNKPRSINEETKGPQYNSFERLYNERHKIFPIAEPPLDPSPSISEKNKQTVVSVGGNSSSSNGGGGRQRSKTVSGGESSVKGIMGNITTIFNNNNVGGAVKKRLSIWEQPAPAPAPELSEEDQWKYIYGLEEMPAAPAPVYNIPQVSNNNNNRQRTHSASAGTTQPLKDIDDVVVGNTSKLVSKEFSSELKKSFDQLEKAIDSRYKPQPRSFNEEEEEEDDDDEGLSSFEKIFRGKTTNLGASSGSGDSGNHGAQQQQQQQSSLPVKSAKTASTSSLGTTATITPKPSTPVLPPQSTKPQVATKTTTIVNSDGTITTTTTTTTKTVVLSTQNNTKTETSNNNNNTATGGGETSMGARAASRESIRTSYEKLVAARKISSATNHHSTEPFPAPPKEPPPENTLSPRGQSGSGSGTNNNNNHVVGGGISMNSLHPQQQQHPNKGISSSSINTNNSTNNNNNTGGIGTTSTTTKKSTSNLLGGSGDSKHTPIISGLSKNNLSGSYSNTSTPTQTKKSFIGNFSSKQQQQQQKSSRSGSAASNVSGSSSVVAVVSGGGGVSGGGNGGNGGGDGLSDEDQWKYIYGLETPPDEKDKEKKKKTSVLKSFKSKLKG